MGTTNLTNPSLEKLQQTFIFKARGYEDLELKPSQLNAFQDNMPDAAYCLNRKGSIEHAEFAHSALTQLLTRLKIPTFFYRRNPASLQAKLFNYWKMQHKTKAGLKKFLIRLDHSQARNHIRAVMSDKYGVIDDLDLFDVLFKTLGDRDDVVFHRLSFDSHITRLFVDFCDATGVHNEQTYTAGICITNSETGHSSVWIEPVVRTIHSSWFNRRTLLPQGVNCRIIHRGELARDRLPEMVETAKEIAQVGIIQLAEQFQIHITGIAAINMAKHIEAMPSRFIQLLEEEWSKEEDVIKAEAAQRILSLAQELPLFQQVQIQQDIGKTLGLFENYKARFSDLAQEINDDQCRTNDGS